jgi:hypothetical protein
MYTIITVCRSFFFPLQYQLDGPGALNCLPTCVQVTWLHSFKALNPNQQSICMLMFFRRQVWPKHSNCKDDAKGSPHGLQLDHQLQGISRLEPKRTISSFFNDMRFDLVFLARLSIFALKRSTSSWKKTCIPMHIVNNTHLCRIEKALSADEKIKEIDIDIFRHLLLHIKN